jgi:hypothetical protein
MIDLYSLITSTYPYVAFRPFCPIPTEALADVNQLKGADGYGIDQLFCCLLLQFMEDLSNRELGRYLEENLPNGSGFTLSEPTPDYSLFTQSYIQK